MKTHAPRHGFTLIELSIVMVIIGLIIGSVLAGKDLIKASELRKNISKVQQFDAAMVAFKIKYGCLPGDCAKASELFPGSENGNGDGRIEGTNYSGSPGADYCYQFFINSALSSDCDGNSVSYKEETSLVWEHLSQAGMVPISAFLRNNVTQWLPNTHFMSTNGKLGMFALYNKGKHSIDISVGLWCDVCTNGATFYAGGAYFNQTLPSDGYYYDTKVDDGKPGTGHIYTSYVMGYKPPIQIDTCAVADSSGVYQYDLRVVSLNAGLGPGQDVNGGCNMVFDTSF